MPSYRLDRLEIHTGEGVSFSLPLASPVRRMMAYLLDVLIASGTVGVVTTVLSAFGLISTDLMLSLFVLASFIVFWGYWIVLETLWGGRTLGKLLLGLRVVDERALPLRPVQLVIRNLLRPIDQLPLLYLVGGVSLLASRWGQRLGDLAAGTVVVTVRKPALPTVGEEVLQGRRNEFARWPHLEARLRQRAMPQQVQLAVEALWRRERLEPRARLAVFAELAGSMRQLVEFPASACEGLSDEQYVRNVLHSLLRPRAAGAGGGSMGAHKGGLASSAPGGPSPAKS